MKVNIYDQDTDKSFSVELPARPISGDFIVLKDDTVYHLGSVTMFCDHGPLKISVRARQVKND